MAIETLSDNVPLEIFNSCLDKKEDIDPWYAGHVWPAFPIAIWDFLGFTPEEDIIIVVLEHHKLACENQARAFHKR